MQVNIDEIIAESSAWAIRLVIGGNTYLPARPSEEQMESLRNVGRLSPTSEEVKDILAPLLCDLMDNRDPADWDFIRLTGAAAAIVGYEAKFSVGHIRAIMENIRAAK